MNETDDQPATQSDVRRLSPREVASNYDRIAERWTGESFDAGNGIQQHQRALRFVESHDYALDIGCGCNGRIGTLLEDAGFEVDGIDLSERTIELARQRFPERRFHQADIRDWSFPNRYDFITAWDSIWHLPLEDQESTLRRILAALRPGGVCIFSSGGAVSPGEKSDEAMGVPMYYSILGIPRTLQLIEENACGCRHFEYDRYPQLHVYFIAQRLPGDAG